MMQGSISMQTATDDVTPVITGKDATTGDTTLVIEGTLPVCPSPSTGTKSADIPCFFEKNRVEILQRCRRTGLKQCISENATTGEEIEGTMPVYTSSASGMKTADTPCSLLSSSAEILQRWAIHSWTPLGELQMAPTETYVPNGSSSRALLVGSSINRCSSPTISTLRTSSAAGRQT
mmetsp:Transcript_64886/g.141400  ORF Transcript_64886/g.141400 Transcript_64886/m.141400 type:complete len:177 (-) Transcript_64886:137-667(-)